MSALLQPKYDDDIPHLKIPPHSIGAEQSVIGGLFLEPEKMIDIESLVTTTEFYRQDHRLIFEAQKEVYSLDGNIDIITVSQHLKDKGHHEDSYGLAYIGTLAKDTPSAANIEGYARIVRKKSQLRSLISVGSELADSAFNSDDNDASNLVQIASKGLDEVLENQVSDSISMKELHQQTLDMISENVQLRKQKGVTGVPAGYPLIDSKLGGFQKRRIYILGGRPSIGKTALSNNFALHASMNGHPTGIITLEMGRRESVSRMLASFYQVNGTALYFGNEFEEKNLKEKISFAKQNNQPLLENAELFIERNIFTLEMISAQVTQWVRKNKIEFVVIDYLQLIKMQGERRDIAVGDITKALKQLAMRLDIAILILSQLSRECEKQDRKPEPSDLRDSGAIEQDADCIIMLHAEKSDLSKEVVPLHIGLSKVRYGGRGWIQTKNINAPHEAAFSFEGKTQTIRESNYETVY